MRRWLFLGALALVATGGSATSTGCGELELPGTLADAGGANARCGVGEDCVLPPPCTGPERFLYVSSKGDDKNDGCSPAKPKATIKSAVTAITKARAGFQTDGGVLPWEVHVCAGTYKESQLVVEYPLSIRGGYDCSGFKRDDNFGYAKGFKSANETILQNGAYSPEYNSPLTFLLRRQDTKITRTDTIIDGLTIDAGEGNSGTVGVTITDGASPTLSDNKIKGGSGFCSSTFGSMGIWVIDGSPLIKNNDIYGGDGKCYEPDTPENARKGRGAGNGSYGMLLQGGGDVEVVDNIVNGGSGTGADATTAISVASAGKREIRNNFITWDKPRMEASGYNGGIGVAAVGDTELNIVGNVIKGGIASCFETCLVWGILAAETAKGQLATMDASGVDIAVLLPTYAGYLVYDEEIDIPGADLSLDNSFGFAAELGAARSRATRDHEPQHQRNTSSHRTMFHRPPPPRKRAARRGHHRLTPAAPPKASIPRQVRRPSRRSRSGPRRHHHLAQRPREAGAQGLTERRAALLYRLRERLAEGRRLHGGHVVALVLEGLEDAAQELGALVAEGAPRRVHRPVRGAGVDRGEHLRDRLAEARRAVLHIPALAKPDIEQHRVDISLAHQVGNFLRVEHHEDGAKQQAKREEQEALGGALQELQEPLVGLAREEPHLVVRHHQAVGARHGGHHGARELARQNAVQERHGHEPRERLQERERAQESVGRGGGLAGGRGRRRGAHARSLSARRPAR